MNLRRHTRLWRWFAVGVRGISGLAIGSHELRGPGSDFDPSDGVPNRAVTGIAFAASDPNVAYVTLSGFDERTPGKAGTCSGACSHRLLSAHEVAR